jgi:hypothetical protein
MFLLRPDAGSCDSHQERRHPAGISANKPLAVLLNAAWIFREVLDCGSPLPLCVSNPALQKCQNAGAR